MLPSELVRKIRRIQIRTNRIVNDVFAGEYHSTFRGRGIEFDEVRAYVPGDDVRSIDWNVTARMGSPYVKRYVEERELTVLLMVDASSSGAFGTELRTKGEIAAEICALFAFSAIKNNDKVGLLIFTDRIERYVPPRKGLPHVLRVIREVLTHEPQHPGTDIAGALEFVSRVQKKRCILLLLSDFQATGYEKAMQIANRRHDLVSIVVSDPREVSMPGAGIIEFEDAETGERVVVDTASRAFRDLFARRAADVGEERESAFRRMNVDSVEILTSRSYVEPLMAFFKRRAKRL